MYDVKYLALVGAPYIYGISRLRVNWESTGMWRAEVARRQVDMEDSTLYICTKIHSIYNLFQYNNLGQSVHEF
jgi:hypothetical protein